MHSLISEKSREQLSKPAGGASAPKPDPVKARRIALFIALGVVALVAGAWAIWPSGPDVPDKAVEKSGQIAAQIRELEEADKRIRPPMTETPPPDPRASAADPSLAPKNLRSRTPQ